jgi:hypothetical protein
MNPQAKKSYKASSAADLFVTVEYLLELLRKNIANNNNNNNNQAF